MFGAGVCALRVRFASAIWDFGHAGKITIVTESGGQVFNQIFREGLLFLADVGKCLEMGR